MESRSRSSLARTLLRLSPRGLYLQGLTLCDLLEDLDALPAATVLMPQDAAFDALPVRFRDLLVDDELTHALFDLFEASIVPGHHAAVPAHGVSTLHGSWVAFEEGGVRSACTSARVVDTVDVGPIVVHVVDRCVLPPSWLGVVGIEMNGRALVA